MSGREATKAIIKGEYALSVGPANMDPPSHWAQVSLLDIAQLESGHTPSRRHSEWWDGDVPWISIPDAREHHGAVIYETRGTTNEEGLANSAARLLPENTVCLSRTASVGYVTVMGCPMATSQDFVNWICSDALDPHWLKYLFIAEERALKDKFGKGTTHTTIYFPEVKAFHVCLPPLNEQRRIVAKIDVLQARSRRAREALEAIPALLDRFRQSVLAAAFRGDLTAEWRAAHPDVEPASVLLERIRAERKARWIDAEAEKARARAEAKAMKAGKPWTAKDDADLLKLERAKAAKKYEEPAPVDPAKEGLPELPEGWCWARWEQLSVDVTVGFVGSMTKEYRDEGVPFLRSQNVRMDAFDSKGLTYIGRLFHLQIYKSRLRAGDLAVVRSGSVGTTCVIPESLGESNCSDLVIIQSPLGILPELGACYMNSAARDAIREGAVGVTLTHYNTKSVAALPVPVPPEPEQATLLSIIQQQTRATRAIAEATRKARPRLGALDQSILAQAFRGGLVPQDPSDEPASELLKRIQAERAAASTDAKPKRGRKRKN